MNTPTQHLNFPDPLASQMKPLPDGFRPWTAGLRTAQASPVLLRLASAVVVLGMLLVFHSVVTQAVHQSGLRQQAQVARSQALSRCNQLASPLARSNCLLELPKLPRNGV